MGDRTGIQWTATQAPDGTWVEGATFNGWIGCEHVSAECDHCYAESGSKRLAAAHRLTLWGEGSSRFVTSDTYWRKPLTWNRKAERLGVRIKVFCASYADVFEDRPELVPLRNKLGLLIDDTPHLDWLLLTKRPENIARLWPQHWSNLGVVPPNVWLGTTVGTCGSLHRVDELRRAPRSVVKFLSCEPLLDDFSGLLDLGGIDWLIVGGESGGGARPMHRQWAERFLARGQRARVPVFMKQMGRWVLGDDAGFRVNHWLLADGRGFCPPLIGPNAYTRPADAVGFSLWDSHGGIPTEWPEALRVREFPRSHVRELPRRAGA